MPEPAIPDDLAARAAAGDLDAGYELLGRQVSTDDWRDVLDRFTAFAADGQPIDLELVARRTIRRPVTVVSALLDLCRAAHTTQSLFIAIAVQTLRADRVIQERATAAIEQIEPFVAPVTASTEQAPAEPLAALYLLLSKPLGNQRGPWRHASDEWRAAVTSAIRDERDRLRDLTKETSASSGSYLHHLRHRLADLILVAGIGDDLGEWAFRILQLRTEELDDLRELLRETPREVRQRYISWVLTPRKGAPVDRIRFLLRLAGKEFPDDLDIDALRVLASHPDPAVAADALVVGVELLPDDSTFTRLASQGIADLPTDDATRVAAALLRFATEHIKIATIPADRADLLVKVAADHQEKLASAIADQLATLRDTDALLLWVRALEQLPTADATLEAAARDVVQKATDDPRPDAATRSLERFLEQERFRGALWTTLNDVPPPVLSQLAPALLQWDAPHINARHLGTALHQLTDEPYAVIRGTAIEGLCEGVVDAGELAAVWPASDRAVAESETRSRIERADAELGHLEADLVDIDAAMRRDLAGAALPIVQDAIAASTTNAGIHDVYRRLAEALETSPNHDSSVPPGETATIAPQLGSSRSDSERLQALFKLDTDSRDLLASIDVKDQLVHDDFAQRVLHDLFERGAMFQIAVRLSAEARHLLLDAATITGFQPPVTWTDHPALGTWLRQELARRAPVEDQQPREPDLTAIFQVAATTFGRLHALRQEAAAKRGQVSRDVAARLAPLFNELNATVDGYYQVWRGLQPAGWHPVEVIGQRIQPLQLNADRHEILSGQGSPLFIVRRPGIEVDGEVIERAQLEGTDG